VSFGTRILEPNRIWVGSRTTISNSSVIDGRGGLTIGDDVWTGCRVVILPGVRIGSNAVIGAGSVVTRDVPDWAVAAGVPAKVIRDRRDDRVIDARDAPTTAG